jgi:hypothetical protein
MALKASEELRLSRGPSVVPKTQNGMEIDEHHCNIQRFDLPSQLKLAQNDENR